MVLLEMAVTVVAAICSGVAIAGEFRFLRLRLINIPRGSLPTCTWRWAHRLVSTVMRADRGRAQRAAFDLTRERTGVPLTRG